MGFFVSRLKTFSSYANNETTEETIIEETKLYKRFVFLFFSPL